MGAEDLDAALNLSSERKQIFARLKTLYETIAEKMHEFSRLLKEAEASGWGEEHTRRADAVFNDGVRLNREYSDLLNQMESGLSEEERNTLDKMEEESRFRVEEPARFFKKDLVPDQIPSGQIVTIEDSLEKGLDHILAHVPREWLSEQRARLGAAGDTHLRQPLILTAGIVDTRPELQVHPYAYALLLAEDCLAKRDAYDIYQGSLLVPCISAMCEHIDAIHHVKGGVLKLEELPQSAPEETLSRIFELLVAGRASEMGRDVEFLEPTTVKTPDLRIHDLPFPAVAECKKQSRLSASERKETAWIRALFGRLARERFKRGLIGELTIDFTKTIETIEIEALEDAVIKCTGGINPYSKSQHAWGIVSFSPLEVSVDLPEETRLYSPSFLKSVFNWDANNAEYDGICAVVENDSSVRVGRAELPFCLKWRISAPEAIERKARNVVSALAEAISQVPVGEGSFVYISYDDSRRPSIANRRTEKIIEVAKTFQVRKRGTRPPLMIVINRLYPSALEEGRPDLVESAIPMSLDEDPYWPKLMPTRVFV